MSTYNIPGKVDLTPRKYHGYAVLLFIMGTLFPPLDTAVAARFGIGKDFWLNVLLTVCGYIPGHGHNFYIQNIRNNKTHARTPKWAQKWGLVDTSEIKRKERRSQWASRYNDRLPHSTLEGQPLEEGQEAGSSSVDLSREQSGNRGQPNGNGDLWRPEDESYYNRQESNQSSGGRWHYPANFDEAELTAIPKKSKKKKEKKDRWARTQEAYTMSEEQSKKKKSSKRKKNRRDSVASRDSSTGEFPEDPEGGLYGNSSRVPDGLEDDISTPSSKKKESTATPEDIFSHQF
ncbi:hypothetical protein AN958_06013 [Leucoagaricus sp. SymC.cos]|nr:hypothetical protein AN958_06013 [Leucoagaricus sp. SymC.cos]